MPLIDPSSFFRERQNTPHPKKQTIIAFRDIILLPRMDFTDDELQSFLPDKNDPFTFSVLQRYNPGLSSYDNYKTVTVLEFTIDHRGIVGTVQLTENK